MNTTKVQAAFIDIDGTLLKGQSQLYFVQYLYSKKKISFVQYTLLVTWFLLYKISIAKTPKKALSYALDIFANKPLKEIEDLIEDFFTKVLEEKIYPETPILIKEIMSTGKKLVLVSAAIEPIVARISRHLNITDYVSTLLEVREGVLTGRINGEPVYGVEKLKAVLNYVQVNNIDLNMSDAYADHLSDRLLLERVQRAVAVNPTSSLLQLAKQKKWEVRYLK